MTMRSTAFGIARTATGLVSLVALVHCGAASNEGLGDTNQAVSSSSAITPVVASGMCLDVAGGSSANGTPIQLWNCNGQAPQAWTYTGGKLKALGKCLDLPGGDATNGNKLELYDCNDNPAAQQWNIVGRALVNAVSGKCLDLANGVATPGARLEIWDCSGNAAAQNWNMPSAFAPSVLASLCDATSGDRAQRATNALVDGWYNGAGYWKGLETWQVWQAANFVETISTHMLYANVRAAVPTIQAIYDAQDVGGLYNSKSYDDVQWVGLSWLRFNEISPDPKYVARAKYFYDEVSAQWDDTCGGGVWWSGARDYKNAITNELYVTFSMRMYEATRDQAYLDTAKRAWAWFAGSGMINGDGIVNDGLDTKTCKNNGQTTWTYNQGTVLSGLALLAKETGDASYTAAGTRLVDSVLASGLVDGASILVEPCEGGGGTCNADQSIFKGIFVRHLGYFLETTNRADLVAKYRPFLAANVDGIWNRDNQNATFGLRWGGPYAAANAQTQASALDALDVALRFQNHDVCSL